MMHKFRNTVTGEITIHNSDRPRRDSKTQVMLELITGETKKDNIVTDNNIQSSLNDRGSFPGANFLRRH